MTDLRAATEALLQARRSRDWIAVLPDGARPQDEAEAYAIQDAVAAALAPEQGGIAAWKVGAANPEASPFAAPILAGTLRFDDSPFAPGFFQVMGVEAELAYRMGRDLPPRAEPYAPEEVLDAVASLHPAIEIADTRFMGLNTTDRLSHLADQQSHGALIVGPALTDWRGVVPTAQPFILRLNGQVAAEGRGGNPAGDPARLLHWMANHAAARHGGLKAGDVVTTGSCCGAIPVPPGTVVEAEFPGIGTVRTTLG